MLETVPNSAYPTVCRYGDLISNVRSRTEMTLKFLGENEF